MISSSSLSFSVCYNPKTCSRWDWGKDRLNECQVIGALIVFVLWILINWIMLLAKTKFLVDTSWQRCLIQSPFWKFATKLYEGWIINVSWTLFPSHSIISGSNLYKFLSSGHAVVKQDATFSFSFSGMLLELPLMQTIYRGKLFWRLLCHWKSFALYRKTSDSD